MKGVTQWSPDVAYLRYGGGFNLKLTRVAGSWEWELVAFTGETVAICNREFASSFDAIKDFEART